MTNAWKVIWRQAGKRYFKTFNGEKPSESGAIEFGKKLQSRGLFNVAIVSKRKPFDRPFKVLVPHGLLWCPYCLKIREFKEFGIRYKDGTRSPKLWRCPVCHISIHDGAVRRNNWLMVLKLDIRAQTKKVRLPTTKTMRKLVVAGGRR